MEESLSREEPIRIYHLSGDCVIYTIIFIDLYIGNDPYFIYFKLVFSKFKKEDITKLPVSNIKPLIDRDNILVTDVELFKHDKLNNKRLANRLVDISLDDCLSRPISNQVVYSKLVLEILRYIDETAPRYYNRKSKIIDFISGETIKVGDEFIKYHSSKVNNRT